ncbi:phosphoribosylaminoimidazolecarboxamide formyltransferase, partial [Akkermansia sp. BIOML-A63]
MLFATKNSSYNLSSPFILYLCHTLKINKPKYYKTMAKELELKYGCNPNQKP